MSTEPDTIAAVATPPGVGGIGIVRVSGPGVTSIAVAVAGSVPEARVASLRKFRDSFGRVLDEGLALYLPGPGSYTGEDTLELQGHGGPVVLDLVLQRVLDAGARLARPGEFSERAFLNDRLDLSQAEAVADLIEAATTAAARGAMRSLEGAFSARISELIDSIVSLRVHVEAAIDFPEEEIDFLSDRRIAEQLEQISERVGATLLASREGALLREGLRMVIAGPPNVGKSSLLNRLTGTDSAIVTDVPGTTRDVLREHIQVGGTPFVVYDTAGLRASADPVERIGIERAWQTIEDADVVLMVSDDRNTSGGQGQELIDRLAGDVRLLLVSNKVDLSGRAAGVAQGEGPRRVRVSAKTGAGLGELTRQLEEIAGVEARAEGTFMARRRHLEALEAAAAALAAGSEQLHTHRSGELLAEELRAAQRHLGAIMGEFTTEELLGRIFESFCIGK